MACGREEVVRNPSRGVWIPLGSSTRPRRACSIVPGRLNAADARRPAVRALNERESAVVDLLWVAGILLLGVVVALVTRGVETLCSS